MKRSLAVIALLLSSAAGAKSFHVDQNLSSVSFTTTKNQYVIEPATIPEVKGSFKDTNFELSVDFSKVETGIEIRDQRINELYLTKLFPTVTVKGSFNLKSIGRIQRAEIPASITLYGNTREVMLPVVIQKGNGYFSANSVKPILIRGADFGIPSANLTALAATVGGIAISDTIPVNFNVVFTEG